MLWWGCLPLLSGFSLSALSLGIYGLKLLLSFPGMMADDSLTFVFGINTYNAVKAMDNSRYGDNSMEKDISGPNTTESFS